MSPDAHPQHRATTSSPFPFGRPVSWFLGLLLALGGGGLGHVGVNALNGPAGLPHGDTPAVSSPSSPLQQFSAGGHILGFGVDQVYVASGNHALQVRFVDAQPIPPQSESASGGGQPHGVPVLTAVRYPELWPGVDLTYRAAPGGIAESVWQIAPGADVARVRLRYNRPLALNPDGSLAIRFDTGVLNESAPVAWQERNSQRQPVAVAFALNGERELGFTLGEHDPGLPVWIDPTLTWNTFLGGAGSDGGDTGVGIAVDGSGNVYVSGYSTAAWGNPVRAFIGGQGSDHYADAFAAKLDSSGNLLWNTFLGGSGIDFGSSIAVDGTGKIFIAGNSSKPWGNPVRAYSGIYDRHDGFAAQLDNNGTLIWNTFLGSAAEDRATAIVTDGNGNVYVAGNSTASWESPVRTYRGKDDAFTAKLDTSGNLIWNTFLGSAGGDSCYGLTADGNGKVYVTGYSNATWSSPIREHSGGVYNYDAFVAQLGSNGSLIWNTFLGESSKTDVGKSIAVSQMGKVYVTGSSGASWGNPVRAFSGADAFVAQLDSNGDLLWNTFLGGVGSSNNGTGIAVDESGQAYVVGLSNATWGDPERPYAGGNGDAFFAQLSQTGTLIWNTFLGGSAVDSGSSIVVDSSGGVLVSGQSGGTWGRPVRSYDQGDVFVARFSTPPGNTATLTVTQSPAGILISSPAGINCGTTCSADFSTGSTVTLTPTANTGYSFDSWSGACAGTGPCVVAMDGDKNVAASFIASPVTHALNLTRIGNGTVTSSPAGIDCGATCRALFNAGTVVALTPSPGAGYQFGGWGGACSGAGACVVNMDGEQSVTAQFNEASTVKHLLKVARMNTGLVTSAPGGIVCGGQERACSALLSTVTLTAYPNPGYAVKDWVGCPGSVGPTCTLSLTAPAKVKARFVKLPKYPLKIVKTKNGAIISDPPGLSCGYPAKTCKARFVSGTVVSLTAVPKTGRTFSGWGGACSGTGACTLTLDGQKVVEAAFE